MKIRLGKMALNVIGKLAPTLAAALGGPMAGAAASVIADHLGVEPSADLDAVLSGANPEQLAALKQADHAFRLDMEQKGIDVFELEIKDTQNARDLARHNMMPQVVLSAVYTVAYAILIVGLLTGWFKIPPGDAGSLLSGLIGVLTAAQIKILDFWFGSSHGSKMKTPAV